MDLPPPQPLDFVVWGVARSGTTALRQALELEPGVFCANEFFRDLPRIDHARLRAPECFLDEANTDAHPGKARHSRARLREKLRAGPVLRYGNKQPPYYHMLARLQRQVPGLRHLCVLRPAEEIARSWDRRFAGNVGDLVGEGRTGHQALYEWLILAARLAERPDGVAVVDYRAMFYVDDALVLTALEHIGVATPDTRVRDRFRREVFRGGTPPDPAPDRYSGFAARVGAGDIEALMTARRFLPAADLAPMLADHVTAHAPAYLDAVVEGASADPKVREDTRLWAMNRLHGWDDPDSRFWPLVRGQLVTLLDRLGAPVSEAGAARLRLVATRLNAPGVGDADSRASLAALAPAEAPEAATAIATSHQARQQAQLHLTRAQALAERDRIEEAIAEAEQALALDPRQARFGILLGKLWMKLRRPTEAAAAFAKALAVHPHDAKLRALHDRAAQRRDGLAAERAALAPAAAPAAEAPRKRAAKRG